MRRPTKPKHIHLPEVPFTVRVAERRCFEGVTFLSALMNTTRRYVQLSISGQHHRFDELSGVEPNDLLTVLKTTPDPDDKLGTTLRVLDFREVVKRDDWVPAPKFSRVRLYPSERGLNVGDLVRVVIKTQVRKARVDSDTIMPPDHLHAGRYRLQLLDEKTVVHYHEKPKRIIPIFGTFTAGKQEEFNPEIIVCSDTARFRMLSRVVPESSEHVLEVGCSTGEATKILAKYAGRVSALDVGAEMVDMTQSQFSGQEKQVSVEVVDVRKEVWFAMYCEELLEKHGTVNVAFVDVGGQSPLDQVAAALAAVLRYAKVRRVIVVKSVELWKVLTGTGAEEGNDRLRTALSNSKPRRRQLTKFEKRLREEKK